MKENYLTIINRTVAEGKKLAFENNGFQLKKQHDGMSVYCLKLNDNKVSCFKTEFSVNFTREQVMEIIHPTGKNRCLFDPFMESCEILEEINDTVAILWQKFKPKLFGILSARDSVDLLQIDTLPEYSYCLFSSIEYAGKPPTSEYVRGWAYPMGLFVIPTSNPNVCKIVVLSHVDFNLPSLIPRSLVDSMVPRNLFEYMENLRSMNYANCSLQGKNDQLTGWRK